MKTPILICLAAASLPIHAQLNEKMRKKMESNQPLAEVIRDAEAAAAKIGGQPLTKITPDPDGPAPKTSLAMNERFRGLEAQWTRAGLSVEGAEGARVIVSKVEAKGVAAASGILPGDVVIQVADNKIEGLADFILGVGKELVDEVTVNVLRGGELKSLKLKFPAETKAAGDRWQFKKAGGTGDAKAGEDAKKGAAAPSPDKAKKLEEAPK